MKYNIILIIMAMTLISCSRCELTPMLDKDGGHIVDAQGEVLCECICNGHVYEGCNDPAYIHPECLSTADQ